MQLPDEQSGIRSEIDKALDSVYTSIPCSIESVANLGEGRIDVKPLIEQRFRDGTVIPFATIYNVQVMFPSTTRSAMTFPLEVGDNVLCVFSQRGLDAYKLSNGTLTSPVDFRKFSQRDAIAIPGITPFANSVNLPSNRKLQHDTNDVVLAHNINTSKECEYRLKKNGDVIVNSPTKYIVNAPVVIINGETTVNGNTDIQGNFAAEGGSFTHDNVNVGKTHTHNGSPTAPVGPVSPTGIPIA